MVWIIALPDDFKVKAKQLAREQGYTTSHQVAQFMREVVRKGLYDE